MKIADGVYVHFIPTQKYKTNRIVFRMTGSLNKQTIAKRALVSQMLATANQTYPTVQSFKERLASPERLLYSNEYKFILGSLRFFDGLSL